MRYKSMRLVDLEKLTEEELQELEDMIDEVQSSRAADDAINVERRRVAAAIKKGVIDFKSSKTLMEWLAK